MWTRDFKVPGEGAVLFQVHHLFAPLTRFQGPVWRLQVDQDVTLQAYLVPVNDQPSFLHVRRGPTLELQAPIFQVIGQLEANRSETLPLEAWLAEGTLWWLRSLGSVVVVDTLRYSLFAAHLQMDREKFPEIHRTLAYLDLLPLCDGSWISLETLEKHPYAFLALPRVAGPGWVEGRPVVRKSGLYAGLSGLTRMELRPLSGESWISQEPPLQVGPARLTWGGPVQPFAHLPLRFDVHSSHRAEVLQKLILEEWATLLLSLKNRSGSLSDYCWMLLVKAWPEPYTTIDWSAIPNWAWDHDELHAALGNPSQFGADHPIHHFPRGTATIPLEGANLTWEGCGSWDTIFDHVPLRIGVRSRTGKMELRKLMLDNWQTVLDSLPGRQEFRFEYCCLLVLKAWPDPQGTPDLTRIPDSAWQFPGLHRGYLENWEDEHPFRKLWPSNLLAEAPQAVTQPSPQGQRGHYNLSFRLGPATLRFREGNDGICHWEAGEEEFDGPLHPDLRVNFLISAPNFDEELIASVRQAFLQNLNGLLQLLATYPEAQREYHELERLYRTL